jgi:predicted glycosyltransferase
MRRNLRRHLQEQKYLQTLAHKNVRFNFFICTISALAFTPLEELLEYYKALVEEELPCVLRDIRQQLEVEEDNASERFADIQRSIERFLDYVEATYIGKVKKSGPKLEIRTEIRTELEIRTEN